MQKKTIETLQIIAFVIVCLLCCLAGNAQVPKQQARLDTVETKVIFTDNYGSKYEVNRSEKTNRSFIIKNGKKLFLFRHESPTVLPAKFLL
jgi:hypothetical protein